jgi:hypothetical protein
MEFGKPPTPGKPGPSMGCLSIPTILGIFSLLIARLMRDKHNG